MISPSCPEPREGLYSFLSNYYGSLCDGSGENRDLMCGGRLSYHHMIGAAEKEL
jgi:hypothetical protein